MKVKTELLLKSSGFSMYPMFWDKDTISVQKILPNQIRVDDVVVHEKKNYYITHRVVYIDRKRKYIITKGDNTISPDKPIRFHQIIGKVGKILRHGTSIDLEEFYLYQSNFYFGELKKVTNAFSKESINFVYLKGLPVFLFYCKELPRRVYVDCDILIDSKNFNKVSKIMSDLGYKIENSPLYPFSNSILKDKTEYSFSKIMGAFKVNFDLHLEAVFLMVQTKNLNPLYPNSDVERLSKQLLFNKRWQNLKGTRYPLLSVEDQIIYLALNIFHHNYQGYSKYTLLERIINTSKFDPKRIANHINDYNLQNFIYPVFYFLFRYYHPAIKKVFLKNISPQKSKLKYIQHIIRTVSIFQSEDRIKSGTIRFRYIYSLSPANNFKKPLVFINIQNIFLVSYVIFRKLMLFWNTLVRQIAKKSIPSPEPANQNQPSRL